MPLTDWGHPDFVSFIFMRFLSGSGLFSFYIALLLFVDRTKPSIAVSGFECILWALRLSEWCVLQARNNTKATPLLAQPTKE